MNQRLTLLNTVKEAFDCGLCINPPRQDGSKAPLGESDSNHSWDRFKTKKSSWEQISNWYDSPLRTGIGLFCGQVSGNLEALDFDDRAVYETFKQTAIATGLGTLVERIEAGYLEFTPHGVHWLYKCPFIAGNTKLATRPKAPHEMKHGNDRIATLIETRGEGGYIIIAPSYGEVNESGPYVLRSGSISTIPNITCDERNLLLEVARTCNVPDQRTLQLEQERSRQETGNCGMRPGDDFNAKATWDEVLIPHGYVRCYSSKEKSYYRRPGKTQGVSATTNHADSDMLYMFSTSTEFEPHRGYNKFSAYALLNHGGNFAEAARELARMGYGDSRPISPSSIPTASTNIDIEAPELFTDLRVSQYLARLYIDELRYWPAAKKWLVYDGKRWGTDVPGGPYPFVRRMIKQLLVKGYEISDAKERVEYLTQLLKLEGHQKQTSILSAAQHIPELVIDSEILDKNPMLLNVRNGTLALETGHLRAHSPADYITRIIDIDYDPNVECPEFMRFLNRIFDLNQNLIEYFQRFLGYCLTGRTDEQVMLFMYGEGANGKTTLANIIEALLSDFAVTAGSDLLMHRDYRTASNDLAALQGARLVKVSEYDDGERLSEAQIKTLTGGDRVTCRFLYGEFFQYVPSFKILLLGNYKPRVRGRDYAIWRRIHLLPFKVTIPESERDSRLFDRLKNEMPGILAWAVKGCLIWQSIGLCPPSEVREQVEAYRQSEDVLQQWIDECCLVGCEFQTSASILLKSFIEFSNWRHISAQKFGRMLAEKGFLQRKSGTIVWAGIGLPDNTFGGVGGYDSIPEKISETDAYKRFAEKNQNPPNHPGTCL